MACVSFVSFALARGARVYAFIARTAAAIAANMPRICTSDHGIQPGRSMSRRFERRRSAIAAHAVTASAHPARAQRAALAPSFRVRHVHADHDLGRE